MKSMINAKYCVMAAVLLMATLAPLPAVSDDEPRPNNLTDMVVWKSGRLLAGQNDVLVDAHGKCRWLDNTSIGTEYFIPFASEPEWTAFISNAPGVITRAPCCPARTVTLSSTDGSDNETFNLPVGRVGAADSRGHTTLSTIFSFDNPDGSHLVETVTEEFTCQLNAAGDGEWVSGGPTVVSDLTPPPPVVEEPETPDTPDTTPAYIDGYIYSRDCRHKRAWDTPFSLQDTFFKRMASGALQWFNSYPGDSAELYCMGSRQRNDPAKVVFEFGDQIPANTYRIVAWSVIGADGRQLVLDVDLLNGTEAGGGVRTGGGKKYSTRYYVASYSPLVIVNEGHHKGSSCKPCSGIAPNWLKVRYYIAGPDGLPPKCGTAITATQFPGGDLNGSACAYDGVMENFRGGRGQEGLYTWTCVAPSGNSTECHASYETNCGGDRFGGQTVRCLER